MDIRQRPVQPGGEPRVRVAAESARLPPAEAQPVAEVVAPPPEPPLDLLELLEAARACARARAR